MARRKKYPKLPNGYGSIKYLGKGRRNPYAVHPPVKEWNDEGIPITPRALCYVDDWMKGFAVLTSYHSGTYQPGMETELIVSKNDSLSALSDRILADYNRTKGSEEKVVKKTFSEVYEEFYEYKYVRDKSRTYSKSSINATKTAYRNCSALYHVPFEDIRHKDMQAVLDECPLKHASLELILSLLHQMYTYALAYEIVNQDYSQTVRINKADDDEHGVPFTDSDIHLFWDHKDDPIIEMLLIMIYSGFRITEYKKMEVNLEERYFKGGIKTKAGKDRIVPIYSAIYPLVCKRMDRGKNILDVPIPLFRRKMYEKLDELSIDKHTPHDCRHTFSALCEKYKVSENDRKRMLGHSFGNDITNGVYGHRTLEDLRIEIEKIEIN